MAALRGQSLEGMLTVIARELQLGRLTADLTTTLLSDAAILRAEGL